MCKIRIKYMYEITKYMLVLKIVKIFILKLFRVYYLLFFILVYYKIEAQAETRNSYNYNFSSPLLILFLIKIL